MPVGSNNERLVYHIFNARQVHLVPGFIAQFRDIGARYNIPTRFILCSYSPDIYDKYKKLIDEIGPDNFELIEDSWSMLLSRMHRLLGNRNSKFIIHGIVLKLWYLLSTLLTPHTRRFSWVCWGSGIEEKGVLQNIFKRRLYNSFSKINCLMSSDKNDLKARFKVDGKAHLIPYVSNYDLKELDHIPRYFNGDKVNVLVGHRATPYLNHIALLQQLSGYADKNIRVICFLNYGSDDKQYIRRVMETGITMFGDKFVPVTKLLTKDEWEGVMKSIDVTLIAGKGQAGLGSIYRTILYKGAVFLDGDGKNMEWLRYMRIKACRIEDLPRYSFEEFVAVIDEQQKLENQRMFLEFVDKKRLLDQWKDFIVMD
jgi:hypothetical protein